MKQVDLIVIGQNYSTSLGLIQAAGEAGFSVGAIHFSRMCPKGTPLEFKSKYVVKSLKIKREDEQKLISILINQFTTPSKKTVLLPSDDYSVTFIDRNMSDLQKHFYIPHVRHGETGLIKYMNKKVQSDMAIAAGLPTAQCWEIVLDGKTGLMIPDDITYPCITKPQCSVGSPKTYICRCDNKWELHELLEKINKDKPCPILIEQFVDIDIEYTVPILAVGEEVFIPVFLQKIRTGSGAHKGVTIAGKVVASSQFPQVVEKMKRLVSAAGLHGVFDVELLRSGDTFYFNELNLRNGAAGYALTRAGINMPALWIGYCRGEQPQFDRLNFKDGLTFVSDKAAIENFDAGYINWKEYRNTVKTVDFRFLVDNPDTPIRHGFKRIELKTIISRMLKR